MFDIGWSEMAIIMLLALIIIGPKDLPRVARTIGQWVRKGRMLAREFQTSLEDMAKETELDDVRKEIEKVGKTDLKKAVENTIDPKGELTKAFDASSATKGEDTVAKTLNGSASAKADSGGQAPTPAKAEAPTTPAQKTTKAVSKTSAKPRKPAAAKKPATKAKKADTSADAPKARTARRPATPKKRAAKPASPAQSGTGDPSPADDSGSGGAAMTAKSS